MVCDPSFMPSISGLRIGNLYVIGSEVGGCNSLYEGSGALGGNLIPAGAHDFKKELNELNDWYQKELEKEGLL